ncbi:galectin-4-like isoform X2 [Rhinatrema bivittatum]|uniref:galectin-4-like isoform X2 n=1 Tax=Rhinatrema bivittatum TaxID=194408 RepID=UPI0011283701|nr:galectin-4-like isoform X2 [Rhinatrema bivittatum]
MFQHRDTSLSIIQFHVNFACGQYDGADIAFHFNPRFDGRDKVVFNSFEGGSWCSEEQKKDMPFQKGEHFELVFLINSNFYQVNVNGAPFYEFSHRIPLERVESLHVDGEVTIQSVNIIGGGFQGGMGGGMVPTPSYPGMPGMMPVPNPNYPSGNPPGVMPLPNYPSGNLPMMTEPTYYNPPVPYYGNVSGGMSPKRTVIIRGFIPQGANRFHVNFKVSYSGDVALHINPRMTECVVVRNSFLNGAWGPEERDLPNNPFRPGEYFDLSVRCGNYRFKVFMNGQHLFNYEHRFRNFQQIDAIEVDGNVVLSYVQL